MDPPTHREVKEGVAEFKKGGERSPIYPRTAKDVIKILSKSHFDHIPINIIVKVCHILD